MHLYLVLLFLSIRTEGVNISNSICTYTKNKSGSTYHVNCKVGDDMKPVSDFLKANFSNDRIGILKINPCDVKLLLNDSFDKLDIINFQSFCPFQDIEENALSNIPRLNSLTLKHSTFSTIPTAIKELKNLQYLYVMYHQLTNLNIELQNLTSLKTLEISDGPLTSISNETFDFYRNLTSIDLSHNRLQQLPTEIFNSLQNVKTIKLNGNQLRNVDELFENINPQVIELYQNNLTNLENVFHKNMLNLTTLKLEKNPLKFINNSAFSGKIINVKLLDLSECDIYELDPYLLRDLKYLEKIDLDKNHIKEIPSQFFYGLKNLSEIKLDGNSIQCLEGTFTDNWQIQKIFLTNNQILNLDGVFGNLSKLSHVYLKENSIKEIHQKQFGDSSMLQVIDLSYNRIEILETKSFDGLIHLQLLNLSRNNFATFNYSIQNLPELTELYADSSNIQELKDDEFLELPKLSTLSLNDNYFPNVDGVFKDLPALTSLYLGGSFETLTRDSLPQDLQLKDLSLDAPLACDCRFEWFLEWISINSSTVVGSPLCNSPERLRTKNLDTLALKDFLDCSDSCICECVSVKYNSYVRMDCSSRNLYNIPSSIPDRLGELLISNNFITTTSNIDLSPLNLLIILDLSHNNLTDFNISLPNSLKFLHLNANHLYRLNNLPKSLPNLNSTSLSQNAWICDCQTEEFKHWITNFSSVVEDVDNVRCGNLSENKELQNEVIMLIDDSILCPSPSKIIKFPYLKVFIYFGIVVISVLLLICICMRRKTLKSILYWKGCTCFKRKEVTEDDKKYDAIIIYHPFDRKYIKNVISKALLREKFIIFAAKVTENESKHWMTVIPKCKRIIIVISKEYVENYRCMEIFRTIFINFAQDFMDKIMVIKFGLLPSIDNEDSMLKSTLTSGVCLNCDDKYFWQKLIYFMPKTGLGTTSDGRCIESVNDNDDVALITP